MPIIEVLDGRLWQADADPNIFAKIREREWSPVMVIDLQEFPARGIIRGGFDVCCYRINTGTPVARFAGPEIDLAPPAVLAQQHIARMQVGVEDAVG